jgi:L-amino acid N-acyltransferase YncA
MHQPSGRYSNPSSVREKPTPFVGTSTKLTLPPIGAGGITRPLLQEEEGNILGTYYLRANQAGGGDHVANCGYMTSSQAQGRGIARLMLEHSLVRAQERGFRAMQLNFVVSTNERAIKTWEAYGFAKVGLLPQSFRHPALGFVDAFVMSKQL